MTALLLVIASLLPPTDIGKINAAKQEARQAYASGDYARAAEKYQYLVDSLGVREEEVLLNLAGARFQLNDTTASLNLYRELTGSANKSIRSRAYQQLGVMSSRQGKLQEAADAFRSALVANAANQDARYNYEMVMKKLAEQQRQQQQQKNDKKDQKQDQDKKDQNQQNKDQQKKDQQNKDQKDQKENKDQQDQQKKDQEKKEQQKKDQQQQQKDQEEKEKQEQEKKNQQFDPNRMKQLKVSEQKAKMILDAMKNNEIQYLQQNKRRATKPKDKNKPDW